MNSRVIIRLFTGQMRAREREVVTILICGGISAIWLALRARFTAHTDGAYELVLGKTLCATR